MAKKPHSLAIAFANIFGTLGYMSMITQWLWASILVAYPLLTKERLSVFLPDTSTQVQHAPAADYGQFTPIVTSVAIVITLLVLVATIYLLVKLPSQIGKKGQRLTHATATNVLPAVHRRPLGKKQKKRMIDRITWWVKALLVIVPLIGLVFASLDTGMSQAVIMTVGVICAIWSSLCFTTQFIIAKIHRLDTSDVW